VSAEFKGSAGRVADTGLRDQTATGGQGLAIAKILQNPRLPNRLCRIFKTPEPKILGKSSINPPKIGLPNRA